MSHALTRFEKTKYGLSFGMLVGAICALADTATVAIFGFRIPYVLPPLIIGAYVFAGGCAGGLIGWAHGKLAVSRTGEATADHVRAAIRLACYWTCIVTMAVLFVDRFRLGYETYMAETVGALPICAGILAGLLVLSFSDGLESHRSCRFRGLWQIVCVATFCGIWQPFSKLYQAPTLSYRSIQANLLYLVAAAAIYFALRPLATAMFRAVRVDCGRHCVKSCVAVSCLGLSTATVVLWGRSAAPIDLVFDPASADAMLGESSPNVVLIVMDTVRADHLSAYGYDRDTTPRLAAFARDAVRFDQAVAPSSWTLPSHASMFTGLMPTEHGAHNLRCNDAGAIRPLDDKYLTLAETLSAAGYRTGAVVANTACLSREFGVQQGFDYYDDYAKPSLSAARSKTISPSIWLLHWYQWGTAPWRKSWSRHADEINADVAAWLSRVDDESVFLFVNYLDPHAPYDARASFDEQIGAPAASSDIDRYDQEIAFLDARIGALFDDLDARGMFDDALIIVTSDHGEAFGEHGQFGHGKTLYQEEIHVPLLVRYPGGAHVGVHYEPTPLTVIPALVLDYLGLPRLPAIESDESWSHRVLAELRNGDHPNATADHIPASRALYDPAWIKTIVCPSGAMEVFDLTLDPMESFNISAERPELVEQATASLEAWMAGVVNAEAERSFTLSEELSERLKSLGYLK